MRSDEEYRELLFKRSEYSEAYPPLAPYLKQAKIEAIELLESLDPLSQRELDIFMYHFSQNMPEVE